jgi:hypothetical protein
LWRKIGEIAEKRHAPATQQDRRAHCGLRRRGFAARQQIYMKILLRRMAGHLQSPTSWGMAHANHRHNRCDSP